MAINYPTKFYPDFDSLKEANGIMSEFQVLRNILRNDYATLLKLAKECLDNKDEFNSMYRACLVQLFTTIEADLFGLRTLDPYVKSKKDKNNFYTIFTRTFSQIAKTWDKEDIYNNYLKHHFSELMLIKEERNNLTHAKKISNLTIPTSDNLTKLENTFNNYKSFMNKMMNGFFIGCKSLTEEQVLELQSQSEDIGLTLKL